MRGTIRDMRRAPARIAASILAIALAMAAIGVFAVPGVSESSVRTIAAADNLLHLQIATSPLPADAVDGFGTRDLALIEARTEGTIETIEHGNVLVVGRANNARIDRVRLEAGRLPERAGEVVATPGLGIPGDSLTSTSLTSATVGQTASGAPAMTIVGIGDTTWFSDTDAVFTLPETAGQLLGFEGVNRIVARHVDPSDRHLDAAVGDLRSAIEQAGATVMAFPETLPDGAHPIEEETVMVSFMIGGLGVVAGIVALVLLASTANAVVTERSRDAAIMRAVGGTRREVRRELRRLAIAIGVIGTVLGLPLGIIVANLIARMVLTRFVGITPDIGVDPVVLLGSAIFGILGARLVSGRVARRVVNTDLATALRDNDGVPFGQRWTNRVLARLATGGLLHRMALRAIARRRARAVGVAAQFAGAVAAAILVASLATTIFDFNDAELDAYRWETATTTADPVFPFPLDEALPGAEVGIHTLGQVDGWEVEIFGVEPDTAMFDTTVVAGSWLDDGRPRAARGIVVAERFATQEGHAVGDTLQVDLASASVDYEIVGLHPIRSVAVFVIDEVLAADLGSDGRGDTIWATGQAELPADALATTTTTRAQLFAEQGAARDAILAIFAAIGLIVVVIAALGASSTVAMNLFERRAEVAAVQATGAQRQDVRRLLRYEVAALAIAGWAVGVVAGALGARLIMDAFATTNAVELGFTLAWLAVPATAFATLLFVELLVFVAARRAGSRPVAVTLRAAT